LTKVKLIKSLLPHHSQKKKKGEVVLRGGEAPSFLFLPLSF